MSASHAFVDESLRGHYVLCAVVVAPSQLQTARRVLRGLCNPGQRRLHMHDESDRRKRKILSAVAGLGVEAHVYQTQIRGRPERTARDDCLRRLIDDVPGLDVVRLMLESCGQDREDNQVIRDCLAKLPERSRLTYLHSVPALEPLLWLPDIVAWAHGRGGDWARRSAPVVARMTVIEP